MLLIGSETIQKGPLTNSQSSMTCFPRSSSRFALFMHLEYNVNDAIDQKYQVLKTNAVSDIVVMSI